MAHPRVFQSWAEIKHSASDRLYFFTRRASRVFTTAPLNCSLPLSSLSGKAPPDNGRTGYVSIPVGNGVIFQIAIFLAVNVI